MNRSGSRVAWLATGQALEWKNKGGDLVIAMPGFDPNALASELQYAYAFRISDLEN